MKTATAQLTSTPLFEGLGRSQRRAVEHLGTWIDLGAGRVLCHEGEPGEEFFVVVDGTVGAQSSTGIVSILQAGEWFGEVSLLRGGGRRATVTTFTPATVVVFDRREFAELLRIAPSVKARLERSAARLARPVPPSPNDRPPVTRPAGAGTRA